MLEDIVKQTRSYRRFDQTQVVQREMLLSLVDLARLSASGGNVQPLKFVTVCDEPRNTQVLDTLAWAGYLKDWSGPDDGEKPTAFIVILLDTTISKNSGHDAGIAAQSIMLGATEQGLGGCMFGSINRKALAESLSLPEHLEILLVLALGVPVEEVALEVADGDIKYYRDANGVHHVPKRPLSEIVLDIE